MMRRKKRYMIWPQHLRLLLLRRKGVDLVLRAAPSGGDKLLI